MAGGWEQLRLKRTPGVLRPVAVIRACLLWSTFPKDFICILLAFERLFVVACTLCRSCPIARDSWFSSKLLVFLKVMLLWFPSRRSRRLQASSGHLSDDDDVDWVPEASQQPADRQAEPGSAPKRHSSPRHHGRHHHETRRRKDLAHCAQPQKQQVC